MEFASRNTEPVPVLFVLMTEDAKQRKFPLQAHSSKRNSTQPTTFPDGTS